MRRAALALLIASLAIALAAMAAVFGAYAGLATATHWQQVLAAAMFVGALAGATLAVAAIYAPGRRGAGLTAGAIAAAAASILWLLLFLS